MKHELPVLHTKIQQLKETAQELNRMGDSFPALSRNTARILASIAMLEINISDLLLMEADHEQIRL